MIPTDEQIQEVLDDTHLVSPEATYAALRALFADPRTERLVAAANALNEAMREGGNCQRAVDAEYDLLAAARGERAEASP